MTARRITRMIRRAFLLLLFALPVAAAQLPDLALALTLDKPAALTGERVGAAIAVTNRSNVEADHLLVNVLLDPPQQKVTITGPAGWSCNNWSRSFVSCTSDLLAAGAQAAFRLEILTRNDLAAPAVRLTASVLPSGTGSRQDVSLALEQHPVTAALSLHATLLKPSFEPAIGTAIDVLNHGPAAAHNVLLRRFGGDGMTMSGEGWTCTATECTRPVLGAGEGSTVRIAFVSGPPGFSTPLVTVGAELSFDPYGSDNEVPIPLGPAYRWSRILLPVSMLETPGANGSLWRTDVTAFVDSDTPIVLFPRTCDGFACLEPQPLRTPFDLLGHFVGRPGPLPATFVYTLTEQAERLTVKLRVRDLTRTAETWGTEIPAVRQSQFRETPVKLMPLPVDPRFRTTVRAYDLNALANARVAIHVYQPGDSTPRKTFVRELVRTPDIVTDAALPRYPGYLQLDPIAEAGDALAGAETAWIQVEPLTPGLQFWAFATVTNNATGHVTTVTPQ